MGWAKTVLGWNIGAACLISTAASLAGQTPVPAVKIAPATMPAIGTVDERFQSYNIEAVEVTGGRFWKPYSSQSSAAPAPPTDITRPGMPDPSLYEYRAPIDLSNPRLRKLARALGPAYLRVSGTWMNSTYFQDSDEPAPSKPPEGFNSVLTRKQWKGVIDFAQAVDAKIVTSFATSAGTRDADAVWTPKVAQAFLDYTRAAGGNIAAAEFMNEPTFANIGGAPNGYDGPAYARDFVVFSKFANANAPGMIILGPGGIGEGTGLAPPLMHLVKSEDILQATGPVFPVFSYHSYGAVSSRCAPIGSSIGTTSDAALSADWLARGVRAEAVYAAMRDKFEPGKPIWNTETGQAACGGDRWAATFVDTFRYLNQLGSLARIGVQVQIHNTLNASDYGLLDEKTLEPRPDYWAALLWRTLMGTMVLDPGSSREPNLHLYAQCQRDKPGSVSVLAINADRAATQTIDLSGADPTRNGALSFTLTSTDLMGPRAVLNGQDLKLGEGDSLPKLSGLPVHSSQIALAPESITFLTIAAGNPNCK